MVGPRRQPNTAPSHGVNIHRGERWLLSDAPDYTNAAVDLRGSVEAARESGVSHVVFISDACRTAPDSIQAGNVYGVEIFPNPASNGPWQPVDQFFATLPGREAAEIKDHTVAAGTFRALYTTALLEALSGEQAEVLEPSTDISDTARYVMPVKLKDFLAREIPRRLIKLGLAAAINQRPDAIIIKESNWISRVQGLPPVVTDGGPPSREAPDATPHIPPSIDTIARDLVWEAASGTSADVISALATARATTDRGVQLAGTAELVAQPFGPDRHETQCGIKVRGARILNFWMLDPGRGPINVSDTGHFEKGFEPTQPTNDQRDDLRLGLGKPVSVLLVFEGGDGTVVPAVPGFLTALTFEEGELVDVSLEPSRNNQRRGDEYATVASDIRALRGAAAAASREARFRLDGPAAPAVAQKMRYARGLDPARAVYAAYAYHDLQEIDRLRQMSSDLRKDLSVGLFDVALFARELRVGADDAMASVIPFTPMLAQGWALLGANRVKLAGGLDREKLQRTLSDSLWSLYDRDGTGMLEEAIKSGKVR